MTADQFVRQRQSDWERLERLLGQTRRGNVQALSERDLRALGELYRATAADLALAQRDFPRHSVTSFLNNLVGRAHHVIYQGAGLERRRIRHFLTAGFPQLFRRNWRYVAAAALLLFVPALICGWLTARNPDLAYVLFPGAGVILHGVEEEGELWIDIPPETSAAAGAFIMTNNIRVSFLAFAGGALAGLLTIYVLVMNGLLFGVIFGFVTAFGLGPELGAFVVGHGPIELSVICI
ncbi:MAG: stage II sporulation protein M, partial [Ardenticatenaceae bacterium]